MSLDDVLDVVEDEHLREAVVQQIVAGGVAGLTKGTEGAARRGSGGAKRLCHDQNRGAEEKNGEELSLQNRCSRVQAMKCAGGSTQAEWGQRQP